MTQQQETTPEPKPTNLGREWLDGLNRELRRVDNCLENMRSQCTRCHASIAGLRSDVNHLRDDLAAVRSQIDLLMQNSAKNTVVAQLSKEVADSKLSWQEAKVRITLIWSGVATIVALVVSVLAQVIVHLMTRG